MSKLRSIILSLLISASFGLTLPVTVNADDDDVKYIYYPANQVYFNPVQKEYFYQDNGTWVERTTLPSGVTLNKGVDVILSGPNPYVHHSTVIKKYPTTYVAPSSSTVVVPAP